MDSAIASALEKFIEVPSPTRASRRSRGRRQASTSAERGPPPSSVSAVPSSLPASSSATRRSSPPSPPTAPPPPPPRAPPPLNALSAEHLGSSGQGCRGVLACARDGGGWHADHARQSPWTTPRGQDITAVFRLVQRPAVRVVQLGDGAAEEIHENLLVTLMVDVPPTSAAGTSSWGGGGSSPHDGPLRLRMLRVSSSHHPKQGFVTVVRLTHVVPEILRNGSEAQFQVEIPGTMVAEFLRVEAVNDDPQRMTRFTMVAFSPAPRSTSRRINPSPPSHSAATAPESALSSDVDVEDDDDNADTMPPVAAEPTNKKPSSASAGPHSASARSTTHPPKADIERSKSCGTSPAQPSPSTSQPQLLQPPEIDPQRQPARRKGPSRSSPAGVQAGASDASQRSTTAVGASGELPPQSTDGPAAAATASAKAATGHAPPKAIRADAAENVVVLSSQVHAASERSNHDAPPRAVAPPAPSQLSETRRQALRELITAYTKRRCIETEQLQERNRSLEGEVTRLREERQQQRRVADEDLDSSSASRRQRGSTKDRPLATSVRQFQDDAALLRCAFESAGAGVGLPTSYDFAMPAGDDNDDGSQRRTSTPVGYAILCGRRNQALNGAAAPHAMSPVDAVANLQRAVGTRVRVWVLVDSPGLHAAQTCAMLGRGPSLEWWECRLPGDADAADDASERVEDRWNSPSTNATCVIRCLHPVAAHAVSAVLQVLGNSQFGAERSTREATSAPAAVSRTIPVLRLVLDETDTFASLVPVLGGLANPTSRFLVVLRARSHFATLLQLGTVVGRLTLEPAPSTIATWCHRGKRHDAEVGAIFATWCATVSAPQPEFAWRCGAAPSSGPTVVFTTQHPLQCVLRADGAIGNSRFVTLLKELHGGREATVAAVACNDVEAMMSVALTTSRRLHWSVVCVVTASRWSFAGPNDERAANPAADSSLASRSLNQMHLTSSLLDSWMDAVSLCGSSACPHTVVVCSDDLRIVNRSFLEGFTRLSEATEHDRP